MESNKIIGKKKQYKFSAFFKTKINITKLKLSFAQTVLTNALISEGMLYWLYLSNIPALLHRFYIFCWCCRGWLETYISQNLLPVGFQHRCHEKEALVCDLEGRKEAESTVPH